MRALWYFDRARADIELHGDLTVLMACGDQLENLPLALSQTLDAPVRGGACRHYRAPFAVHTERVAQHLDQLRVFDRLLEKIEGAVFQRSACGGDITVRRDDHQRHLDVPRGEFAERQPRDDALLRGDAPGAQSGVGPDACVAGFAMAGSGRPR